eukprot:CAMPEP_0197389140 /NCGR_PEP_ID=MMETSP1165-20131217/1482_1 /TAXON_ID=284809 /ORGANISM="Chrysocystis fragilis, Strain CCMP3189" /LENGTH=239 /DNA_ID=CAMNT_0042914521 /DNA_START=1195 /DNA_END=1915 /DNA_ORIENTATION=+
MSLAISVEPTASLKARRLLRGHPRSICAESAREVAEQALVVDEFHDFPGVVRRKRRDSADIVHPDGPRMGCLVSFQVDHHDLSFPINLLTARASGASVSLSPIQYTDVQKRHRYLLAPHAQLPRMRQIIVRGLAVPGKLVVIETSSPSFCLEQRTFGEVMRGSDRDVWTRATLITTSPRLRWLSVALRTAATTHLFQTRPPAEPLKMHDGQGGILTEATWLESGSQIPPRACHVRGEGA